MSGTEAGVSLFRRAFPSRAMFLLLFVGLVDLVSTAVLHAQGLIVEMNPLMRPLIERSEWLFVAVKGMTLLLAWAVMWKHAPTNMKFVRNASILGTVGYLTIWCTWFFGARG